ncbi:hypothetical protein GCK72_019879 [Caenorhabditis remanei]|uniref:Uncharacterized protein n=1 Tax=Caenorhabditis remanei TaxID=31234 RepID=A0A6A5GF83_CAERE|nr:hypothetical protein GCK72_019879 [Caenorhabditis remanei]KAF1753323.1 hypothetical protein GCK72_019879 [Caenorhabditis remanei]
MPLSNSAPFDFPAIGFSLHSINAHGTPYLSVRVDYDPLNFESFSEDAIKWYQWVDDKFVLYHINPPRPPPGCPEGPHSHDGGFFVKVEFATWLRNSAPVDRPRCQCNPWYDTPLYDHSDPPECQALAFAAVIADGLREGKMMEDIKIEAHLFELPSTSRTQNYWPSEPTRAETLSGLSSLRRAFSTWNL